MSYLDNLTLPPIKIPNRINLILHLLKTEIKHNALTNAFDKLGMDTSPYATNLGSLVLSLCGVAERTDYLLEWYYKKLEVYSDEHLRGELDLNELAFNFHMQIMIELRK